MNRNILTALVAVGGCAILMGCTTAQAPPVTVTTNYRRVCLVEFADRTQYSGTGKRFTDLLARQIVQISGDVEVVVAPAGALTELIGRDPIREGRVPLKALIEAQNLYGADALVVGSVDAHNPYWSPSVRVSLKVIDVSDGTVTFQSSEGWDAGSSRVQRDIMSYYKRNRYKDECRFGPDVFTVSPRYFLLFVADSVAHRMLTST